MKKKFLFLVLAVVGMVLLGSNALSSYQNPCNANVNSSPFGFADELSMQIKAVQNQNSPPTSETMSVGDEQAIPINEERTVTLEIVGGAGETAQLLSFFDQGVDAMKTVELINGGSNFLTS